MRLLTAVLAGLLFTACGKQKSETATRAEYVNSGVCAGCHAEIAKSYRETGMGR
jgi:cytochrome c553